MKFATMTCVLGVLVSMPAVPASASSCDSLATPALKDTTITLKDTTITLAQLVAAGGFSAPGERQATGRSGNPFGGT